MAQRKASQGGGSRGPGRVCRDPPVPPAPFGMPYSQVWWGVRPRPREIPPPKKRPPTNPSPAPGRSSWNRGGSSRGRRGQGGAIRAQPPHRQPLPDPGRLPGPLQLMGPGDPVQKLALMMAVMMLGMPPVNGYNADMGSGAQGERQGGANVLPLNTDREWQGNPGGRGRGQSSSPTQGLACGARRAVGLADFTASPAGNGKSVEDKGGDPKKGAGGGKNLRKERMEPRLRGERLGRQTQERGRSEGDGRTEEGGRRIPRQRPKKRPDVPESWHPQLVKNKQREEHRTGSATPAVQRGSAGEAIFCCPTMNSHRPKS